MTSPAPTCKTVNLGNVDLVPIGKGKLFSVMGISVAVFRSRDGSVFATQASCPHKGGNLADGILGQRTLVCPLHACSFDVISGKPAGHSYGCLTVYSIALDAREQMILTFE